MATYKDETMTETDSNLNIEVDEAEARLKALEDAEKAVENAYKTGKVDRATITKAAQLEAAEAVAMVGVAMEADEEADEAMRISVIAEQSGDRERAKSARKKERAARKKAKAEHKAATASAKKAYEAIKYSAPNKLGFVRFVQVVYALHIVFYIVFLLMTSRDTMTYGVSTTMDWIMVILEGVAFWMFINRYKQARFLVIGMAAIGIIVPAAAEIASGTFSLSVLIFNSLFYIFLIFYFAFSKRAKAVLVNDFAERSNDYDKETFVINRKGWPFARNLIIYFIVFSVLGHWMEMGMCQFIIMGLVQGEYDPTNTLLWRDWLYPFPMEGAAVVIIALVLYPLFQWLKAHMKPRVLAYQISFLSNALLCTLIEFSMGLLVNADLQLWDYTDNFCNFMGQVCLQNTMAFGVAASLITWWVYPLMERWIARIPRDIMNIVFVVVALFGAILWSLYLITPIPELDLYNIQQAAQEQTEESEQSSMAFELSTQNLMVNSLREDTEKSKYLTDEQKANILKKLDGIEENMRAIADEVGIDWSDIEVVVDTEDDASDESSSASASSESSSSSASSEASASSASGKSEQ